MKNRIVGFVQILFAVLLIVTPLQSANAVRGLQAGDMAISTHFDESTESEVRSWFLYGLNPGDSISDIAIVTNIDEALKTILAYPVDAHFDDIGGFLPDPKDHPQDIVGQWISMGKSEVTLAPGEDTNMDFTVNVPSDIPPGEYWGAVMIEEKLEERVAGTEIRYRVGVRVYVKVLTGGKSGRLPVSLEQTIVPSPTVEPTPAAPAEAQADKLDETEVTSEPAPVALEETEAQPKAKAVRGSEGVFAKANKGGLIAIGIIVLILLFALFSPRKKGKRRRGKRGKHWMILIVLAASSFLLVPHQTTFGTGGISIRPLNSGEGVDGRSPNPAWFIYTTPAGTVIKDKTLVINLYDFPVEARVYPADATVTSNDGDFALESEDRELDDVGSWITVDTPKIALEANESRVVDFTLTIPENASPGSHAGGILVQEIKELVKLPGGGINILARVGTRVYVDIPGDKIISLDVADLVFVDFPDGKLGFRIGLENTGNIRLRPIITITITDPETGTVVSTLEDTSTELQPGNKSNVSMIWNNPLSGNFEAEATIVFEGQEQEVKRLTTFKSVAPVVESLQPGTERTAELTERIKKLTEESSSRERLLVGVLFGLSLLIVLLVIVMLLRRRRD